MNNDTSTNYQEGPDKKQPTIEDLERRKRELEVEAIRVYRSDETGREERGGTYYKLRYIYVALASKGRGHKSGLRQFLRENNMSRTTFYRELNEYADKHGLEPHGRVPDEVDDPEDEALESGSVSVPFSPSLTASQPPVGLTEVQRTADKQAVDEFVSKTSHTTISLDFDLDTAKKISEMLAYIAEQLHTTKQRAFSQALQQAYEAIRKEHTDASNTGSQSTPAREVHTSDKTREPAA